ncbi:hypothetical protein EJB05_42884, partial [Eragrostis curvula]
MVTYYLAADHHATCPSAPCYCPLVEHFRNVNAWLVYPFSYARLGKLVVPASVSRHILVGEGGDAVLLVSARSLGAATPASLVHVTDTAAAAG